MALETEIKQLKEIMDTLSENQKLNFTLSVFASLSHALEKGLYELRKSKNKT